MHTEVNMVHRDLKPENILLEQADNLSQIKLIDFGTAKRFKRVEGEPAVLYDKVGTVAYMSPEVLKASKENGLGYSEKCDIWSIGVMTYLLLFKDYPIKGKMGDERDLREKVMKFNFDAEDRNTDDDAIFGSKQWKLMEKNCPAAT